MSESTQQGPYTIPRASHGRRREDKDFHRLFHNRWAKRIGAVLGLVAAYWIGQTKDEWARIPSPSWTRQVEQSMQTVERSRGELIELNVRVGSLQRAIEENGAADRATREAITTDIRELREDLKRWFHRAGGK